MYMYVIACISATTTPPGMLRPKHGEASSLTPSLAPNSNTTSPARAMHPKSPKTPRAAFLHSRSPSVEGEGGEVLLKKRLVEQFYRMDKTKQHSSTDISSFRQALLPPVGNTESTGVTSEARQFSAKENEDAFREGNLRYVPPDVEIVSAEKLAEKMVNIDTERNVDDLNGVITVVTNAADALDRRLAHLSTEVCSTLRSQLDQLGTYLASLQVTVDELAQKVQSTTVTVRGRYLGELQSSAQKLDNLQQLLDTLTQRLNAARDNMTSSKQVLSDKMGAKIELLEYILARFDEYDQVNRQRRVRQLIIALSVVVVAFCLYIAFTQVT